MALDHHKHVLVAKPMAVTLEDGERMVGLATRNGLSLIEAHPQSMEIPVLKMREVVESGELGRVRMMHNWTYSAWLYQPRMPEELDTKLGGGVTFRQGAHQFDILRLIGGGVVRSVRAMTGRWDPTRPTEGAHTAFLDFADGTVATAVFSGYDRFLSSELTFGLGQGGTPETEKEYAAARRRSRATAEEAELKRLRGYGLAGSTPREHIEREQPFYGLTIVSCERGDIRQSRDGLLIYGEEQKREVPLPMDKSGRDFVLDEVYRSVAEGRRCVHDATWSLATLELTLAVLRSGRERAEVMLRHQVSLGVRMSEFLAGH
jgi:phthalate 4,5-cis-dihydrodiol dehydrogenase